VDYSFLFFLVVSVLHFGRLWRVQVAPARQYPCPEIGQTFVLRLIIQVNALTPIRRCIDCAGGQAYWVRIDDGGPTRWALTRSSS
jgi:hypothetical protein